MSTKDDFKFQVCIAFILSPDIEGTVSNDPKDYGKLTKFGISEVYFPEVRDPNFTIERAKEIYRSEFWEPSHCEEMPIGYALLFFDARINQTEQSVKLLQRAVGVPDDGKLGPQTLQGIKEAGMSGMIDLAARRMKAYADHKDWVYFGLGWSRRLMRCFKLALELQEKEPK